MKSDWKKVKLASVCDDLTPERLIDVNDADVIIEPTISSKTNTISTRKELSGADVKVKKRVKLFPGDLVFARLHTQNGLFAFCDNEYTATQTFVPVKINEEIIDKNYLFYSLKHFIKNLVLSGDSVGRESYTTDQILSLEITLPTLPEQKWIVKKIKEIEEKVFKLKDINNKRLLEVQAIVDSLINSKFAGISKRELDEKNDFVFSSRGRGPEYSQNSDAICLNQKCNRWNKIDLSHAKTVSKKWFEGIPKGMLTKEEDVIINSTGDGTVGRASLVTKEYEGLIYDSHILLVRLNKNKIDPLFFVKIFNSRFGQQQVEDNISATTTKQTELGMNNLMKTKIPDISIDEQKSIFDFFNKLEQKVNDAKKIMSQVEIYNKAVIPSILSKAFNGEL